MFPNRVALVPQREASVPGRETSVPGRETLHRDDCAAERDRFRRFHCDAQWYPIGFRRARWILEGDANVGRRVASVAGRIGCIYNGTATCSGGTVACGNGTVTMRTVPGSFESGPCDGATNPLHGATDRLREATDRLHRAPSPTISGWTATPRGPAWLPSSGVGRIPSVADAQARMSWHCLAGLPALLPG